MPWCGPADGSINYRLETLIGVGNKLREKCYHRRARVGGGIGQSPAAFACEISLRLTRNEARAGIYTSKLHLDYMKAVIINRPVGNGEFMGRVAG